MSDSDNTTLPKNLEDALEEIDSLKSQLSGSDLKVFAQNRELRQDNLKLKDEIRQLTEQCVTQSFSVRGTEKAKKKVEAELASSQAQVADLEAKVEGLNKQIANLQEQIANLEEQLAEHRSKELHLSQELEAVTTESAQKLERLQAEHKKMVETANSDFEQARLALEQEVSAREQAIQALEERVEQFKEEFLSQEISPAVVTVEAVNGQAFEILTTKLEGFLGFPGRALVEQVFRLSGVAQDSADPSELEEAFEVLQDTASQLVRTPDQEKELAALLNSAWSEIGMGESIIEAPQSVATQASEEPAPSEEKSSGAESQESQEAEVPDEVTEEAQVEDAGQDSLEESVQDSADQPVEETAEAVAEEVEETEPATSSDFESSDSAEGADSPESDDEPLAEAPDEVEASQEEAATRDESASSESESAEIEAEVEPESEAEAESESESEPEEDPQAVAETAEPVAEQAPETEAVEVEEAGDPQADVDQPESEDESQTQPDEELEAPAEAAAVETESEVEPTEESGSESEELSPEAASTAAEPVAEVEEAESQEPQGEASEEPATAAAGEADDSEASEDSEAQGSEFEQAAAFLGKGRHADALPLFEALHQAQPEEATYAIGRVACLAGLNRFKEAYAAGKEISADDLGESSDVFNESMVSAILGMINEADSDLVRKELILELLFRGDGSSEEETMSFLDLADEITLRIDREGELSLLQATHRIQQDDVTEYLIDALHSLSDRPDVFALLRTNLERYPELTPLSDFLESLLDSSRAESLESESQVKDLLGHGASVEDQLEEGDPGEEAVVQVFLEHLIPRAEVEFDIPSDEFQELLLDAEPAAFVGSLRQALRSIDFTVFFDKIDVLSYDGEDHFLLRSSPEPSPTLLFGPELDDVPPEELRFLVLRELYSMYRRHSQLAHISSGLDDFRRVKLVKACIDIFSEFESKVPAETLETLTGLTVSATDGGQDADFKVRLVNFLREVYIQTESDSFLELGDFLYDGQLNRKWLDSIADGFGARQTGIVVASYAICRDLMPEDEFEQLEEEGFGWLYTGDNLEKYRELRLRLQRLWTTPLKALIAEPEE